MESFKSAIKLRFAKSVCGIIIQHHAVVRPYADQPRVICGMMQATQGQSVRDLIATLRVGDRNDMGGVHQLERRSADSTAVRIGVQDRRAEPRIAKRQQGLHKLVPAGRLLWRLRRVNKYSLSFRGGVDQLADLIGVSIGVVQRLSLLNVPHQRIRIHSGDDLAALA